MKICLVHRNNGSDPRLMKISASLVKAGHYVGFIGWDIRFEQCLPCTLCAHESYVLKRRTPHGWSGISHLAPFLRHVYSVLAKFRPDAVHCVNEEMALLVLPWRRILFRWLICDLFDSMKDRGQLPGRPVFNFAVRIASDVALRFSDRLIATDERRWQRLGSFRNKAIVIANVPVDPGVELSKQLPEGEVKVFLSGSLCESRGLDIVISAVEKVEEACLIAAGWCTDDATAERLSNHPLVRWVGHISSHDALRLAAQCDAVFAYYKPDRINNIYASPNKVFDAMSVGRPVIINSETKISSWVVSNGLGFAAPYEDVDVLAGIIEGLKQHRTRLPEFAARARSIYEHEFTWEIMERRLLKLYDELAEKQC
ncbi:MAG: glycosyltransferase [Armatimonadota bacterium]